MTPALMPLAASDKPRAYAVYCEGMQSKLSRCQGWDLSLQRQGFEQSFAEGTLFWYRESGQDLALISLSRRHHGLHVHLLVVLDRHRRQGVGRRVMLHLHQLNPGGRITLSCLRHDKPVRAFYAAMGYHITGVEQDFLQLAWPGPQARSLGA
jgi:GNAT superfamily N-acetyltransferase